MTNNVTPSDEKVYQALKDAVVFAIQSMGLARFKETSFFTKAKIQNFQSIKEAA